MRITAYAQRLLEGLDTIDWPEPLKEMQRNWIGKSVGASVRFRIAELGSQKSDLGHPTSDFLNILPIHNFKKLFTIRIAYRDNLVADKNTAALDAVNFVDRYDV